MSAFTQAYYDGDYWEPLTLATPGEPPSEGTWRRLSIPDAVATAVVYLAASHVFNGQGMADQARVYMNLGNQLLLEQARLQALQDAMPVPVRLGV
jgi:hypothetical protein